MKISYARTAICSGVGAAAERVDVDSAAVDARRVAVLGVDGFDGRDILLL